MNNLLDNIPVKKRCYGSFEKSGHIIHVGGTQLEGEAFQWHMIAQTAQREGVTNFIYDDNGHARGLLKTESAVHFEIQDYPRNILVPGSKELTPMLSAYFGKACSIMPQTMEAFMKFLNHSIAKQARSLEEIAYNLHEEAKRIKDAKCERLAQSCDHLKLTLQDTWKIRSAPDLVGRVKNIIVDRSRVSKKLWPLFSAYHHYENIARGRTNKVRLVIFGDAYYESDSEIFVESLNMGKQYGVKHITHAAHPSRLDAGILSCYGICAVSRLNDPKDIRAILPFLRMPDDKADVLTALMPYQFLYIAPGMDYPQKLFIEPKVLPEVSDAEVREVNQRFMKSIESEIQRSESIKENHEHAQIEIQLQSQTPQPQAPVAKFESSNDNQFLVIRKFLQACVDDPELYTTKMYEHLGIGSDKGNRLKQQLIASGLIEVEKRRIGRMGRSADFFKLTEKGMQLLNEPKS